MDHFADRLIAAVKRKGAPICLGLDPRWDQLPSALRDQALRDHGDTPRARAEAFLAFNRTILDAVGDRVPVCKPQVAFYEQYGAEGWRALETTIRYARERGVLTVADLETSAAADPLRQALAERWLAVAVRQRLQEQITA